MLQEGVQRLRISATQQQGQRPRLEYKRRIWRRKLAMELPQRLP
jgi:hypothetical protein